MYLGLAFIVSEQCKISSLGGQSKLGLVAVMTLIIVATGTGCLFIGMSVNQASASTDTQVTIKINENFYVEVLNRGKVTIPANDFYNCSMIEAYALEIDKQTAEKLLNYVKNNPSYDFDPSTITSILGTNFIMTGKQYVIMSQTYLNMETASTERLDGESTQVNFGNNFLLLQLEVGTYVGGKFMQSSFGFKGNIDLITAMYGGTANDTAFSNAELIMNPQNTLVINGMAIDSITSNSVLNVTLNGVACMMPYESFP